MNTSVRLSLATIPLVATVLVYLALDAQPRYQPRQDAQPAQGYRGAMEYLSMIRSNTETGQVEPADYLRTLKAAQAYAKGGAKDVGLQWIEMGPDNVGGRTRTVVIAPGNPNDIWSGGVSGGLWHSTNAGNTWNKIESLEANLAVSSVAILGNGHVYVGTGNAWESASGTGSSGFIGSGLFRTIDGGATFELVIGPSTAFAPGDGWAEVNKLERDPNNPNGLWVAAQLGLRYYDETTGTFTTPTFTPSTSSSCTAIEVSTDGNFIICARGAGSVYRSTDGGQSFQAVTQTGTGNSGTLPSTSNIGRIEFGISPDDPNYVYAMAASPSGRMTGVWSSTNMGNSWTRIWPPGFGTGAVPELDIFGDNAQGKYDNVLAVRPGHPDEVWLGGVTLWKTTLGGAPQQIASNFTFPGCFFCVHSDVHDITWLNENTCYVGCDGGIFRTVDAGTSFMAHNRDFNITQFYSMALDPNGRVMGGTQDNGTQFVRLIGNTEKEAIELLGGDGFDCDISQLDPNIMFGSIYFGAVLRSNDGGNNFGDFYDTRVLAMGTPGELVGGGGLGDFYTNLRLFENYNDVNSPYVVENAIGFNNDEIAAGATGTVFYRSRMTGVLLATSYTNTGANAIPAGTDDIELGDKPDPATSLFAVGFGGSQGVWVTRYAMNFVDSVQWWKVIDNFPGGVNCLEFSKDGNHLFVGGSDGRVVRVSGFNDAYDFDHADVGGASYALTVTTILNANGSVCTGLAPDPNDATRLMVMHGNYGNTAGGKIRLTTNATAPTPTFSNLTTSLPTDLQRMPIYDGVIHAGNGSVLVVGTELGIMASNDNGATWSFENNGIPRAPVFCVRQQRYDFNTNPYSGFIGGYITNPHVIYAGTHGRGFFRTETLMGFRPQGGGITIASQLDVFPNPATDLVNLVFTTSAREQVRLAVYDLSGKLVKALEPGFLSKGEQRLQLGVNELPFGTYIAEVRIGSERRTARFVVGR
ncbi:MAG: T9SS type A sorting domain-containing protein [Flavobacteriales bacterium]|nr:T9SS type A sorting domain-containing protein [Flavobacteriales bacterium]